MPKVDGKGMDSPAATTPEASVEGQAAKNVPGGESSGKTWFKGDGPNPGTSPKR